MDWFVNFTRLIALFLSSFKYGLNIVYSASKTLFVSKLLLTTLSSFLPFLYLHFWRGLLNALVSPGMAKAEIMVISILYLCLYFVGKILESIQEYTNFRYFDEVSYYLDNLMIEKTLAVDIAFFDSSSLGDELKNATRFQYSIQGIVWQVFNLFHSFIKTIISFILLSSLSLPIALLVVILAIPVFYNTKQQTDLEWDFQQESSNTHRKMEYYKGRFFQEGMFELRVFRLKDFFINKRQRLWEKWHQDKRKRATKAMIRNSISMLLLSISEIAMFALIIFRLIGGQIRIGDVTFYFNVLFEMRNEVSSLVWNIVEMDRSHNEIDAVRKFVNLKPAVESSGVLVPNQLPQVQFNNVSFRYPGTDNYVLKNCSFTIEPGQKVGLVGLNGSGKTTIVKLLLRFYDPTEGAILIDGVDAREYDLVKLRRLFSALFQDFVKYSFTVGENISLSDYERRNDVDSIKQACEQSKASTFIKDFPLGLDTDLTKLFNDEGEELSGGQWQRIALGRAFFRKANFIILDEPSAQLDPEAEDEIFKSFTALSEDKSALLITHRLSNARIADKMIVLENGRIIEEGTHKELVYKKGRYAFLFNTQAKKYIVS